MIVDCRIQLPSFPATCDLGSLLGPESEDRIWSGVGTQVRPVNQDQSDMPAVPRQFGSGPVLPELNDGRSVH